MVKVLLCGDICGDLKSLFRRVEVINGSSGGPFDILLCVGQLLSQENGGVAVLEEYQHGTSKPPIPTYFYEVGLNHTQLPVDWPTTGGPVASNLHYLGASGFSVLENLSVGFLSTEATPEGLQSMAKNTKMPSYIGADILLSADWPRGIDVNMAQTAVDQLSDLGVNVTAVGSSQVAEVARVLKPRYHFAAREGVFFQRQPYRNNEKLPERKEVHTTRFISLGKISKTKDKGRKWLHALGMDPVGTMTLQALATEPAGTTSCPYLQRSTGLKRKAVGGAFDAVAAARIEKAEENRRGSGTFFFGDTTGKRRSGGEGRRRKSNPEDELLQKMAEEDPEMKTVFVGNLKPDCTVEELETVFSQCGKVEAARITPGKCFGFVDLETHESAIKAVKALNGAVIGGRAAEVRWAKQNSRRMMQQQSTPRKPRECWFCLSSPTIETHLIVSIAEEMYLANPKGSLVSDHVQIIPINHAARFTELSDEALEEVEKYKLSLQTYYNSLGMALMTFERNMADVESTTAHMYIEAMPVPTDKLAETKQIFQDEGEAVGCFFEEIENDTPIQNLLKKEQKYFYLEIYPAHGVSGVTRMVHWIEESLSSKAKFSLQFGREVMSKVYKVPERANWKNCKLPAEDEMKQSEKFKRNFKQFDFSL